MTVPTPQADALMKLVEAYADARHKHGAPEYNAHTAAARTAVLHALTSHAGAARALAQKNNLTGPSDG